MRRTTVEPGYVFLEWSSGSNRVIMSGAAGDKRQLLQYWLGEPRAVRLPGDVGEFYGMAAR